MAIRNSHRSLAPVMLLLALAGLLGPMRGASAASVEPSATSILDEYTRASRAVADVIKPSVVFIEVTERAGTSQGTPLPRGAAPRTRRAEASGVIISASGDILTNAHVVDTAARVEVSTPAGQHYTATVVGLDKIRDLAVIRVQPTDALPAAVLGNADSNPAGSWVMAVGFAFGGELDPALRYDPSVTTGVVSAIHRDVDTGGPEGTLTDVIQTDAAINPGNSGGPLVNSRGEVIGINEGIFTTDEAAGNIGVGFAIPIDAATLAIVRTLQSGGSVVRGQLGVAVAPLTPERKQQTGAQYGALVQSVTPGSPADQAGIRAGDVIVGYNGEQVNSTDDLIRMIYTTRPGAGASIRVLRDRREVALSVTVTQLKLTEANAASRGGTVTTAQQVY